MAILGLFAHGHICLNHDSLIVFLNWWGLGYQIDIEIESRIEPLIEVLFGLKIPYCRCCNNCPRDCCPRRQLSKGLLSNEPVVQADFCPRRLLSKEVFTSEKLTQIDFSYFLLEVTILPSSAKLQLQLAEFELYSQLFSPSQPATHPADWESLA